RRNFSQQVPASHIIDITTSSDPPVGGVQSIAGMLVKHRPEERGTPLIGRTAKQAPGLFVVYLSPLPAEIAHNLDLLRQHAWLDIALVYNNGSRGLVLLGKGRSGERLVDEVFADWRKNDGAAAGLAAPQGP